MMGQLPPDQITLFYEIAWKITFPRITCFDKLMHFSI